MMDTCNIKNKFGIIHKNETWQIIIGGTNKNSALEINCKKGNADMFLLQKGANL